MNSATSGRNRRVDLHDQGHVNDARDRHDIADEIVIELVVERRVDSVRRRDEKERVGRPGMPWPQRRWQCCCWRHCGSRRRIAGRAAPTAIDDQSRKDVRRRASAKASHQPHRPRRIGLRPRYARYSRERAAPAARCRKIRRGSFILPPSQVHITRSPRRRAIGSNWAPRCRAP